MVPRLRLGSKAHRTSLVLLAILTAGCYRVRSELISTPTPPGDLYRCVQLELGRSGYAIVGADRASGWLHAQRRVQTLLSVETAEIYATVISDDDDASSHLQLSDNSYAEDDADYIRGACTETGRPE